MSVLKFNFIANHIYAKISLFIYKLFFKKHFTNYKVYFIIYPSKRDTQSQRSLKTWSRAGYKLSADLSRVTPEQKTVLRV